MIDTNEIKDGNTFKYCKEIMLAALLHDIGKFYQKAGQATADDGVYCGKKDTVHTEYNGHPAISRNWIDAHKNLFVNAGVNIDVIKEIVETHHGTSRYSSIVKDADGLSASERGDEELGGKEPVTTRIVNIFSHYNRDDDNIHYIDLVDGPSVKADGSKNNKEYNLNKINEFVADIEALEKPENRISDFYELFNKLNSLLEKHASYCPSAYQPKYPDISLYDHLKTTAALSNVILYNRGKGENSFSLIGVTLCGTDDYLKKYDGTHYISEYNHKREKCDRFLNAINRVFDESGYISSVANVINSGNTKIYIVASRHVDKIKNKIRELNKTVFYDSDMQLYLSFKSTDFDDNKRIMNTLNIADDIRTIIKDSRTESYELPSEILINNGKWINPVVTEKSDDEPVYEYDISDSIGVIAGIKLLNLDNVIDELFKFKDAGIGVFDEYDKANATSVSRIESLYRIIDDTFNEINNIIYKTDDMIVIKTPSFKFGFDRVREAVEMLRVATCGKVEIAVSMYTIRNNSNITDAISKIENALNKSNDKELRFNGDTCTINCLSDFSDYAKVVDADIKVNMADSKTGAGNAELYNYIEWINMYRDYLISGRKKTDKLICMARFNKDKLRNKRVSNTNKLIDTAFNTASQAKGYFSSSLMSFLFLGNIIYGEIVENNIKRR
ncbi:MAG: HD domain-containing protein [Lachnospiraceae bacterium]|nr:HD domain-containing protein [Lachnospiraceae bacterium]